MIRICEDPFEPSEEIRAFEQQANAAGAIVSFLGKVRREEGADPVLTLTLEHFPGVTERSIADIAAKAQEQWCTDDIWILHRVGQLEPGEPIVLVCVSAAHRRDAFAAADFLMDFLKTDALFWKKERRRSGENWIEPRREDYDDAARWTASKES